MTTQPVEFRSESVKVPVLLPWTARKLGRLAHIAVRSPAKLLTLAPIAAIWWLSSIATWLAVGFALLLLTVAAAWAMQFPGSYQHHIAGRIKGTWRNLTVYRPHWGRYLKDCGVILRRSDAPLLLRTNSTQTFDRLTVRLVPGQRLEDYANHADRLAPAFKTLGCRVSTTNKPNWLELMFLTRDPLADEVPPFPPERDALTRGIPIARQEDGTTWRLKLLGNHILVAGATGSGKSEFLRTLSHGLEDLVDDGTVKIWGFDPAGGMQFAAIRHLFDRFIYGSRPTQFADALEEAVRMMQARQDALRGVAQLHTPSRAQPFYLLIIDEIAGITAYLTDRKAQLRIQAALALLKSQGRAVGFSIVGALQDPRKSVVPDRGLYTIRIGFRLNEASDMACIFGPGAQDRGAACHLISPETRGVAEVETEGMAGFTRLRFARDPGNGKQPPPLPAIADEPEPAARLGGFA